jgi:hypothetical protein
MKLVSAGVALLFVGTCLVPLAFAIPSAGNDLTGPKAAAAKSRAEPEYNGTGPHLRSAVYDFSNTFMFSRWSVVMETGMARLMKNLRFQNDNWTSLGGFPGGEGRAGTVAVWAPDAGRAIVMGGYAWNASLAERVYDQPVLVYDPQNGTWAGLGPSKIPAGSAGVYDPARKCVIVCGGTNSTSGRTDVRNETWAFFPSNGSWARLSDMPGARHGQSAVWDPDDGLMLVFGGTDGTGYFNDVWAFDRARNLWTNLTIISDEYPLTRAYTSAVWNPQNGEMVVHGGYNSAITFLSTWAFSFRNSNWIHRTSAPFARYIHAAGFDSGRGLMTVFGSGEYDYTDTWTYDAASDSWAPNKVLPGTPRTASSAVFDPASKRLLVFGGRDAAGDCLDEAWAFTAGAMCWTYFSPGYMQPPSFGGADFHSIANASWTADLPAGTAISLRVRFSGDNSSWSSWEEVQNGGRPQTRGRYVQWNMTFSASPDFLSTPMLRGVRFDYLVNKPPSAAAFGGGTAYKRQPVPLSGGGSDPDGDALSFRWSRSTALEGAFDDDALRNATYTPAASGVHRLTLVCNDSFEQSPPSAVNLTVVNRPPSAMAGPDSTAYRGEFVNLYGGGSDPDGDALFCNWTQLGGPAVAIAPSGSPNASFVAPRSGNYTFRLEVSDGEDTASATVNVTVLNRPPVARLEAAPARAGVNERINFSAALSYDPDGNVTKYLIDFGDGNSTGWTAKAAIGYYYTSPGAYNATALAMDDEGAVCAAPACLTISVQNALPVVDISVTPAGGDIRTVFQFSVSPSSFDPDGSIVSYLWKFGDGASGGGSSVSHNYSRPGRFAVTLRATDDLGGFTEAGLNITVGNLAPVITSTSPGKLSAMKAGAAAAFTAVAADPEGGPLAYSWKVDNRTVGGNNNTFVFRPASKGAYRIAVTVSDGEQGAAYEWGVTVSAAGGGASDEQGDSAPAMAVMIAVVAILVVAIALLARKKKSGP